MPSDQVACLTFMKERTGLVCQTGRAFLIVQEQSSAAEEVFSLEEVGGLAWGGTGHRGGQGLAAGWGACSVSAEVACSSRETWAQAQSRQGAGRGRGGSPLEGDTCWVWRSQGCGRERAQPCLLYTSDAADDWLVV